MIGTSFQGLASAPLVSILTPSFNQARWLQDAIDSVARQDYPLLEHIVMDGGSADGTQEILSKAPTHVRYRIEPDNGQSHALNKAFRESSGEIIGWLNSDDAYFSCHAVSAAVAAFRAKPDAAVVYGHAALVDASGRLLHAMWVPPHDYKLLRAHNYIVQPAAFLRREALGEVLADEQFDYMMDRELWLRLAAECPFNRIDEIVAIDRHHRARKSYTRRDLAIEDFARLRGIYPIPRGRVVDLRRKLRKIHFRIRGASVLVRMHRLPSACVLRRDTLLRLVMRQLVVPRVLMRG